MVPAAGRGDIAGPAEVAEGDVPGDVGASHEAANDPDARGD
jgi:hypothetical protein